MSKMVEAGVAKHQSLLAIYQSNIDQHGEMGSCHNPSISTMGYYFDQWSAERTLKKSGGARTRAQRTQQLDHLLYFVSWSA